MVCIIIIYSGEPPAKKPTFPNPKQRYVSPGEAWWRTTQRFNHRCNPAIFEEFLRLISRIDWHAPIGSLIANEDEEIDYSIFHEEGELDVSNLNESNSQNQQVIIATSASHNGQQQFPSPFAPI